MHLVLFSIPSLCLEGGDFPWTSSMNFLAFVYRDWTILDCHFNMELHLHFGFWHFPCTSLIETAVVPNNFQTRPAFWFWDFPFNFIQLSPSDHHGRPPFPSLGLCLSTSLIGPSQQFFWSIGHSPKQKHREMLLSSLYTYMKVQHVPLYGD